MNKFRKAALTVLQNSEIPLHYRDITKKALEMGILETDGATPDATMNALLSTDIKSKGSASDFIRIKPGIFTINKEQKIEPKSVVDELEKNEDEHIAVETGYTGKAGEHLICSKLLFRGFNASIMSVDVGLDIVAVHDGHMYGIQVKTSNLNRFNTYVFDVRKVSFERHSTGNIFYIFILHGERKDYYLILPLHEMEKKLHEKAILEVGNGKRYRVNIKMRGNKVYLGTKEHEMSYYLDNWDVIK